MIPVGLYVEIVRFAATNPADRRSLLCVGIQPERGDWRVSLFWPGGVGEVDYSLKSRKAWGRRGVRCPWEITKKSARELVVAGARELHVPAQIHMAPWFIDAVFEGDNDAT